MTINEWMERFSYNLEEAMKLRGYTKAELARRAYISKPEVTKLLSGHHKSSVYVLNNLSIALNVRMDDLVMFGEPIE